MDQENKPELWDTCVEQDGILQNWLNDKIKAVEAPEEQTDSTNEGQPDLSTGHGVYTAQTATATASQPAVATAEASPIDDLTEDDLPF